MKFTVEIDGRREELEVVRRRAATSGAEAGEAMSIVRDGERVDVRVVHREGPHFVLEIVTQHGEHQRRRRLRAAGYSEGEQRQLWVNGSNVRYEVLPEGVEAGTAGARAAEGSLSASIPAVVSEILVQPGETVSAGQKLILLESMKMVLPIQAPRDGVVAAIHCAVGEAVQPGTELVEIAE